jgi:hypothetical protein
MTVGKNMKHSQKEKPLILPVYAEAEERFCLFMLSRSQLKYSKQDHLQRLLVDL